MASSFTSVLFQNHNGMGRHDIAGAENPLRLIGSDCANALIAHTANSIATVKRVILMLS